MKHRILVVTICWLTMLLGMGTSASCQTWNPGHAIGTTSGVYSVAHNQTPSPLVEIHSALLAGNAALLAYQWYQSPTPVVTDFVPISGATASSYSFTGPLLQTIYLRRYTSYNNSSSVYSNIVKMQPASASWQDVNYIREHNVMISGLSDWKAVDQLPIGSKLQSTTFLDGLGRPVEKVSRQTATPENNSLWGDMVQFYQYDALGREPKKFLPYTVTPGQNEIPGGYRPLAETEQTAYYANAATYNESFAYAQISFDGSPLNRITNIKEPGTAWGNSAGTSMAYELNVVAENVQIFDIGYTSGATPQSKGPYPAGSLLKSHHWDVNNKAVIEYSNNKGQLILTKTQVSDAPSAAHSGWICVYNVYDDFGLLRYTLQPEAVNYLDGHGWSFASTTGQQVLDNLCFRYEYDDKGRVLVKKAPGAAELRMLYDVRDRLVFMQDGNQRDKAPAEWTVNLYDELDRPVIKTLYRTASPVSTLQSAINGSVSTVTQTINNPAQAVIDLVVNNRQAGITSYTARNSVELVSDADGSFESLPGDEFVVEIDPNAAQASSVTTTTFNNPLSTAELNNASVTTIVKYQFYDDYTFSAALPFDMNATATLNSAEPYAIPVAPSKRTLSFPTGSLIRVLGSGTFLSATEYYDEKGRHIQTLEDNIKQGRDVSTSQYHFDGRLLSMYSKHSAAGTLYSNFGILSRHSYDLIGRLSSVQKSYGSNAPKTIATYDYDDMGRLKTRRLDPGYTGSGKSELEKLSYSYNIHNNITGINKDYALKTPGVYNNKWDNFFGLYLGYDNRDGVFDATQLDGHVGGALWSTQGDDVQRRYNYAYDNAGRLSNALYTERKTTADSWSNAKMDFSVSGNAGKITYDLNGNLLSMLQKGVLPGSSASVVVDNLQYSYESYGNKLLKVTDLSTLGSINGAQGDFKDGNNGTGNDYVYDANGNVVVDLNKDSREIGAVAGANGIRYNFLDKPEEIRLAGKGTITIVYDAQGNKLQRTYTPESGTVTTTTYIHEYVYQGNELQYINFEEGRIRVMQPVAQNNGYDALTIDGNLVLPGGKKGVYDYFIRDYQSNVRMVLTEEVHVGSNQCTMETARAGNEEPVFGQPGANNEVVQTRFAVSSIPGQGSGGGWQNGNIGSHVSRLSNIGDKRTGPGTLLKVMAGDAVSATVQYYYQNAVSNSSSATGLVSDVISALMQAIGGSGATSALVKGATGGISSQLGAAFPFAARVAPDAGNGAGSNPKAYLTVLFFDERFEFVGEGSLSQRVAEGAGSNASLTMLNLQAPRNGYAYVYVSNESNEMVYFDNLQVAHNRGRIVEESHYYAYGLKIAAISSRKLGDGNEGGLQNNYQYQGDFSEMDEDIGWNDFALRNYDAQIGRWVQQDPYNEFPSPYTGMGNDPVNTVDPSGGSVFAGMTTAGRLVASAVGGAIIGAVADVISGGDGLKGMAIGAGLGLGANLGSLSLHIAVTMGIQTANAAATVYKSSTFTQHVGSITQNVSYSSSQGWQGGYNPLTMQWDDIVFNGQTYKVLSKIDILALFGTNTRYPRQIQKAEDRFERIALSAFHQSKNYTYRTPEGKVPEAVTKSVLLNIFGRRNLVRLLDLDIYEVKLLDDGNSLSDNAQQKSFVKTVANSPAGKAGVGSVWYITSGFNSISPYLRQFGNNLAVNIFQSVPYQDPIDPNIFHFSQWIGISGTPGTTMYNSMYGKHSGNGPFVNKIDIRTVQ